MLLQTIQILKIKILKLLQTFHLAFLSQHQSVPGQTLLSSLHYFSSQMKTVLYKPVLYFTKVWDEELTVSLVFTV